MRGAWLVTGEGRGGVSEEGGRPTAGQHIQHVRQKGAQSGCWHTQARPIAVRVNELPATDKSSAEFDEVAAAYDAELNRGLRFTGESKEYFADARLAWTRRVLGARFQPGWRCLDFGCGTGTATPYLKKHVAASRILGVDVSRKSCDLATRQFGGEGVGFAPLERLDADAPGEFDFAYCNGVFHHIPPPERAGAAARVFRALRPGGWFAFWENNAWNPVTRLLMRLVPFDRDAVMLFPGEARRLLAGAGFEIERTNYLFIFPGALGFLRPVEHALCGLPLGAQYLVLARKRA